MRGLVAGALVFIGLVLVPFAAVGIWMQRQVLPTDEFTDLATEVVQDDAVSDALANRFLDELQEQEPRLALGRVVLEPAAREAIRTPQFEQIFRTSVSDMHAQLLRGDDRLSLNLDGLLPVLRDTVGQVNTTIANQIPTSAGLPSITVVRQDQVPQLWFGVQITRQASWAFPVLMVVTLAGAVVIAERRPLMLIIAGVGTAFVCLIVGLVLRAGRGILSDYVGTAVDARAFDAGYDIVTESLVSSTLLLGLFGLVAGVGGFVWLLAGRGRRSRAAPRPTTS